MDRRSFIIQNFNDAGNCGLDDCACEEAVVMKQSPEKIILRPLLQITLYAFLCALVFCVVKMNIANASMFLNRPDFVIACGTNSSAQKEKQNGYYNDHQSKDNNDKSNCPHQFGSSCLICFNDIKRKKSNMLIT